jgi:hypothetical protein
MRFFHRTFAPFTLLVLATLVAAVSGCSSYSRHAPAIREALDRSDFEAALARVEDIDRSGSELLYCYEKGMILHEQGAWVESNAQFERAGQLLDELYTRSVSREVAAATVSETITKYRGDPFEAVLINYYKILNYLHLGDIDGAMVECRRLNLRLQMIRDAGETYFGDDAFLQYLTALVYEQGGEGEDAAVSYRTAARLYGEAADSSVAAPPPWLFCDAAAHARATGDAEGQREYEGRAGCPEAPAGSARAAVLVEYGAIARKVEAKVTLPIFENDRYDAEGFEKELAQRRGATYARPPRVKYWLSVALPVLQVDPPSGSRVVVRAIRTDGRARPEAILVDATRVEDLDARAARAFQEKESTILLRAIARALAKYLATEAAGDADEGLGALVNLLAVVTETADTRSWTTLPRSIHLARLDLEPGTYRFETEVMDEWGRLLQRAGVSDVEVRAGALAVTRLRVR